MKDRKAVDFWIKGLIKAKSLFEIFGKVFLFLTSKSESFGNRFLKVHKTEFSHNYIFSKLFTGF
ncbi:hypothetical protein D0X99_15975 [Algoriphagus lacus]|uniref:Uncharacterized protein n=1 Tax=Algoriphagus lacus TaxID=2056311 RepID=A0A418PP81_9BACT|nr:hypothetical protein D0X99_15975 [Algoriphagus lacus]